MNVYFISGLAADREVFKYIQLPEGYRAVHLEWITPLKNESLQNYALRLSEKIDPSPPFAVIGLSLGGMIATEITKIFPSTILILIASVPCSAHLPWYFTSLSRLGVHKIVPVRFFKTASIIKRLFTAESAEDKAYLRKTIRQSDPLFIKWAIHAILQWSSELPAKPYIHIHGSLDKLLPARYTRPTHLIKGGGHLMVLNHYKEINKILTELFHQQDISHLPFS